jgi:hypothetical protein
MQRLRFDLQRTLNDQNPRTPTLSHLPALIQLTKSKLVSMIQKRCDLSVIDKRRCAF